MASLLLIRKGNTLVPADRMAEQDMETLGDKPVLVDVRKPRSLGHHRLMFSLLRKVVENTPSPISEDALLSWIKVRVGHVEYVPLAFGKSYAAPASISFAKMDQAAFNTFFEQAVTLICEEVIPGLDRAGLMEEVMAMVERR